MTTDSREHENKKYRKERQEKFNKYTTRIYSAGQDGTLASMNLEEGDTLPGDATYEITDSFIDQDPKKGGRVAVVTAFTEGTESAP